MHTSQFTLCHLKLLENFLIILVVNFLIDSMKLKWLDCFHCKIMLSCYNIIVEEKITLAFRLRRLTGELKQLVYSIWKWKIGSETELIIREVAMIQFNIKALVICTWTWHKVIFYDVKYYKRSEILLVSGVQSTLSLKYIKFPKWMSFYKTQVL